ncbi:hypothetical protein Tco_0385737 [Tanacetum coccineum]
MEQMTSIYDTVGQYMQKKKEDKRITEDQAAKDRYWKIPICYDNDDDDDEKSSIPLKDIIISGLPPCVAITPGIPDKMCDVPFRDNSSPLDISKDQFEGFSDSTSIDDDSFSVDDIDYVEASPADSELVSLEEVKDFHTEDGDIKDENSSGSTTTRSDYSLSDYEAFYFDDDHIEKESSGSTTTQSDISLSKYDSFIFDLSNDPFPPADRTHPGELTSIVDSGIRENVLSMTNVNLPFEDDQSPLLAYVVWIFLPFLTYPVTPPYLLSCGNEDTIFDPDISVYHSFMPSVSHRSGTFMKFNDCPDFEASRARGFVLRSLELQILSFILGIQYPNLID